MRKCNHKDLETRFNSGGAWTSIETVVCKKCGKVFAKYEVTAGARVRRLLMK